MARSQRSPSASRSFTTALGVIAALGVIIALTCTPSGARAEGGPHTSCVFFQTGAQIRLAEYRTWLKLTGGYSRWLKDKLWLDLGASALVHEFTNLALLGGVRWKLGAAQANVRPYVRTDLELAFLLESRRRFVLGGRVGGGASYYSSPGFGAHLEAGLAMGPAFGEGVHFAAALDLLVGMEFPF